MKKVITLAAILFITPSISLAAWWNPFSWFQEKGVVEITIPFVVPTNPVEQEAEPATDSKISIEQPTISLPPELEPEPKVIEKEIIKEVPGEKIITKIVTVDNPGQTQKIKELTTQLNEALKTIKNLETQIEFFEKQLIYLSNTPKVSQSLIPVSQPTKPNVSGSVDYSMYTKLENIRTYTKNPLPYFGKTIMLKNGLVVDFGPAIDQTGVSYIHIVDNTGTSSDLGELTLRIENTEDFNKITSQLKNGDIINIYGLGAKSEEFKVVGGKSGSYTRYKPVMVPQRILKCPNITEDTRMCNATAPYYIW